MLRDIKNKIQTALAIQGETFDYYISEVTDVLKLFDLVFWRDYWKPGRKLWLVLPVVIGFVCAMAFKMLLLMHKKQDSSIVLESLLVSGGAEMFLIKLAVALWYRKEIIKKIAQIKNKFWDFNGEGWLKKKIMLEGSRLMKIFLRIYIGLFALTIVACEIRPIVALIFFAKFESPLLSFLPGLLYSISWFDLDKFSDRSGCRKLDRLRCQLHFTNDHSRHNCDTDGNIRSPASDFFVPMHVHGRFPDQSSGAFENGSR